MSHLHAATAGQTPEVELKVNGQSIDLGPPSAHWRLMVRNVGLALAPAMVEQAIEFGQAHDAVIEVWDKSGRLLVAFTLHVRADWQRSNEVPASVWN